MSDHVSKPSHDEEAALRISSQARQPSWMSHWTKGNSMAALKVNESSLICNGEGCVDDKSGTALSQLKIEGGFSEFGKGLSKDPEEMLISVIDRKKKPGGFVDGMCDPLFPAVSRGENIRNTSAIRSQGNLESGNKSVSLALALGREDTSTDVNLLLESNRRSNGKQLVCDSFDRQESLAFPKSSAGNKAGSAFCHGPNHVDALRPVVVFEKHFLNDNFTCFGQDNCKYKKYSSFFIHETGMKNDLTDEGGQSNGPHTQHGQTADKNFQALFYKQCRSGQNHSTARLFPQSLSNIHPETSHQGHHPPESIPCTRNVETMRICTMVDSVQNSPGGNHKVSQRAHHFLFTKETCLNLSNEHQELKEPTSFTHSGEKTFGPFHLSPDFAYSKPSGVKIQPLWTSTDSENTGNSSPFKAGSTSRNEESNGTQVKPPEKGHSLSGMASSPSHKDDTVEENNTPVACDSSTGKTRSKKALFEIPDINEVVPGIQPAASSIDGEETSTSRVHSLDAKQIFSYGKQSSRNEYSDGQDRPFGPDSNNRWIKRLKLTSSDSFGVGTKSSDGEGSSPQKFSSLFGRYVKGSIENFEADFSKHHSEVQMTVDQNVESMLSGKRNKSTMRDSLWIQRWCKNNTVPITRNPEPLVICEPHCSKFGQDETTKKHFPSIGALALMGKAMNGFPSCEFRKRGSVVVWNTREH